MVYEQAGGEIIVGSDFRALPEVNPEVSVTRSPGFDAEVQWQSRVVDKGLVGVLEHPSEDSGLMGNVLQMIETDTDRKERVVLRYEKLQGLLASRSSRMGIKEMKFSDEERSMMLEAAARIETRGQAYMRRVRRTTEKMAGGDMDKAQIVGDGMVKTYADAELAIIDGLVLGRRVKEMGMVDREVKAVDMVKDPRYSEWQRWGDEWEQIAMYEGQRPQDAVAAREELMKDMASRYSEVVRTHFSAIGQGQDYYYFFPSIHDRSKAEQLGGRVKGVNEAQERLIRQMEGVGDKRIWAIPTQDLRGVFSDLEVISREVKIHLMPKTRDEAMVVDRMMSLMEEQPELRDIISAMKVRIVGNNREDDLPEIVIYTDDSSLGALLTVLQGEFSDLEGTGRVPRFNQEVMNRLIYIAQSGGDLKGALAQLGVLDKIFDADKGYAELRV